MCNPGIRIWGFPFFFLSFPPSAKHRMGLPSWNQCHCVACQKPGKQAPAILTLSSKDQLNLDSVCVLQFLPGVTDRNLLICYRKQKPPSSYLTIQTSFFHMKSYSLVLKPWGSMSPGLVRTHPSLSSYHQEHFLDGRQTYSQVMQPTQGANYKCETSFNTLYLFSQSISWPSCP